MDYLPRYVHEMPTMEMARQYMLPDKPEWPRLVYKTLLRRWLRTIASEQQNHYCCYCGRETNDIPEHNLQATLDHVIPRSMGGEDTPENTVMACAKCNRSRGSEDAEKYWKRRQKDFTGPNYRGNRVAGPAFTLCSNT